jgi:phosphonate transport system substrate-binding protein
MRLSRRSLLAAPAVASGLVAMSRTSRAASQLIRFGVGPLQPTPGDTRRVYEPFFAHLAKALDRPFELVATTDWAGIAIALANEQVDCAWLGPWGYIIARDKSGCEALASRTTGSRRTTSTRGRISSIATARRMRRRASLS